MDGQFASFNDFQIERELGQSEDSTFYHGLAKRTRKKVLLKLLNPIYNTEPGMVQAFIEEAKAIRDMNHPGVIQLVDFGQEGGFFFTVYERPVITLMDRLPQLTLSECIDLFQEIVKVLDFMHIQGYIHGHLTPGSVLFREDGTLAIMNLGTFILQSYQNPSFDDGNVSPAAYYKSPEQCRNQGVDNRSDYYSLGAILYHILTKKPPYIADNTVGVIVKHVEAPPPQLSQEYARYQPLLDKMMAKDPFNRTQTGKEILEWLGSGSGSSSQNETLELDFSPDFAPNRLNTHGSDSSASPYLINPSKQNVARKLILPVLIVLIIAIYFVFFKSSSNDSSNQEDQASSSVSRPNNRQGASFPVTPPPATPEEKNIRDIETALQQGELSLAEAKINALGEDPRNIKEFTRLKEMLSKRDMDNKRQQYSAQLTIAEAALHSTDLSTAEEALFTARKILVGPELLRLESLLQQKMTAPAQEITEGTADLLLDTAEDDRTFLRVKMTRSVDRIKEYLQKFPDGRHKEEAQSMLKMLLSTSQPAKMPTSSPPVSQKQIISMNLSEKTALIQETVLKQILEAADFFELRRNPQGRFDNPLRHVPLENHSAYLDPGLNRLWLCDHYGQSLTLAEALRWIEDLNQQKIGGFTDWRLPTLAEGASLLRPKTSGGNYYSISEFRLPEWVWSADQQNSDYAWAIFYTNGIIGGYRKTDRLSSIAVRTYNSK